MFNKQSQGGAANEFETVIGQSVKVKGDFNAQGNIIVEDIMEGGIKTAGNLEVGEKAKVTANVEAREAKIGGLVKGNVKIKGFLEITSTAKIFGDIEAASLSIERGATLVGKCAMPTEIEDIKKIAKEKEA
ncbi:MAG: polymer-forming cytoskeletal protein [Patescibacteria group bacterium]|nr:polymer-forming cytoskeletal protein [Patescibacteria group bacterium]